MMSFYPSNLKHFPSSRACSQVRYEVAALSLPEWTPLFIIFFSFFAFDFSLLSSALWDVSYILIYIFHGGQHYPTVYASRISRRPRG